MTLLEQLKTIRQEAEDLLKAGKPAEEVRIQILGRKGSLAAAMALLPTMDPEERKVAGQAVNQLKRDLESSLTAGQPEQAQQIIDSSVPAYPPHFGTLHPIPAMIREMTGIFEELSFEVVEGRELISEKENFENLNLGQDHPARDSHETFYVQDDIVLRTQTTSVQVLELAKRHKQGLLPARIVVPGKAYRSESDQTHSPMFHQMDAFMVDNQTTFSDLKGCLEYFAKRLFGDMVETRFRPHYFPFTEPSAEIDIRWKGERHSEGRQTDWLEFGGCGMIHPDVLRRAGVNPRIYQGWAFGMSVERPIMVRYQIPDLRRLYDNSLNFLTQFPELV